MNTSSARRTAGPARTKSAAFVVLGCALAGAEATAQNEAFRRSEESVPPRQRGAFATADVDGDGDDDIVAPLPLIADGGRYAPLGNVPLVIGPSYEWMGASPFAVFADLTNDGLNDLLVNLTPFDSQSFFSYFVGVPGGSLANATLVYPPGVLPNLSQFGAISAGDVDGDGDDDLVLGSNTAPAGPRLWLNNGLGGFVNASAASGIAAGGTVAVRLSDLDGDGLADLLVETDTGAVNVQRSLGGGVFAPSVALPVGTSAFVLPRRFRTTLGDLDGDGLVDVGVAIVGSTPLGLSPAVEIVRQTSPFAFANVGAFPVAPYASDLAPAVAFVDLDGDADAEIVVGGAAGCETRDFVGGAVGPPSAPIPVHAQAFLVADADGDGDDDLAAEVRYESLLVDRRLIFNDGAGSLVAPPVSGEGLDRATATPVPADVDGDGDMDLVAYSADTTTGGLLLQINDGDGVLLRTATPCAGCPAVATLGTGVGARPLVAAGDLDGDGDVDLVVANLQGPTTHVLRNDGPAGFVATNASTAAGNVSDLELADFDGDGDLDLLQSYGAAAASPPVATTAVLRLNANGAFGAATALPLPTGGTTDATARDFDGDGDVDVIVVLPGTGLRLAVNTGGGAFVAGANPASALTGPFVPTVDAGDVDGDGDLDLVWGRQIRLRSSGLAFVAGPTLPQAFGANQTPAAQFVDWDRDGDLDVVDWQGNGVVRLQTSQLVFTSGAPTPFALASAPNTIVPAYADLDGDDDFDLVARFGLVYFNPLRQLSRILPLRAGATCTAEVLGPANGLSALALDVAGAATVQTPFGRLAFDPFTAVVVGVAPLDAAGRATFSGFLSAASAAATAGVQFTVQAVVDGPGGPRLTNARTTPVYQY